MLPWIRALVSLRAGRASLVDGFAVLKDGEAWLNNVNIPEYDQGTWTNHEPRRPRKLLLHRREIERLIGRTAERGLTLVPTRVYFSGPNAKVEIALARGKNIYDKRESIRRREVTREVQRELREAQR